jgi:NADPH-dependent 2,4-dienoyl-CoA reductase/sulfur reductase-like enzyme
MAQEAGGNEMIVVHILTLAKEIGVHRNTIRNWVKSGRINARPGPGKGLIFTLEDFQALCREFELQPEHFQIRELSRQSADSPIMLGQNPLATREEQVSDKVIGSVMVVGGGIAGIQASLDLADQGYYVYLVEKSAGIGGKMSQLDKTYPTNDCAM